MVRSMRSHKGTFYVKARSLTKQSTDGTYNALWAKLIPSNMIISKYWIKATIHQDTDFTDDVLQPVEYALHGYINNIPQTGGGMGTSDIGGGASVAHIDDSEPLSDMLKELGLQPSADDPLVAHDANSINDIGLRNGQLAAKFWRDRRFFSREQTLSFPKNAILVNSNKFRYYDTIATNGTRLGRNTNYLEPRMMAFWFSTDLQHHLNVTNNSQMITGSTSTSGDIDIATWDRQAQSAFNPIAHYGAFGADAQQDDLETLGDADISAIDDDSGTENINTNSAASDLLFANEAGSHTWGPIPWMRNGYKDNDSDSVGGSDQSDTDLLIDFDVTLQCQMYVPSYKMVVTTP